MRSDDLEDGESERASNVLYRQRINALREMFLAKDDDFRDYLLDHERLRTPTRLTERIDSLGKTLKGPKVLMLYLTPLLWAGAFIAEVIGAATRK